MLRRPLLALLTLTAVAAVAACGADDAPAATDPPATAAPVTTPAATTAPPPTTPATEPAAGPQRIVSLSASLTEVLYAIGAGDQVVAVDKYSNLPPGAPVTDLSGFKPNVEAIAALDP